MGQKQEGVIEMAEWNQAQAMRLLQLASKQLGIPADQLKKQLQSGEFSNLPAGQAAQMKQVLSNPQLMQQMLQSPQAQQLLQQLKQKGK